MAAKNFIIYYKRGTGTYVVTEPRPWARENQHHFPNNTFVEDDQPVPNTIKQWLINNRGFQENNFQNPDITVLFNLDPNIDM